MMMVHSQKHDQQKNNNVCALLFAVLFVISVLWAQVAIAWNMFKSPPSLSSFIFGFSFCASVHIALPPPHR